MAAVVAKEDASGEDPDPRWPYLSRWSGKKTMASPTPSVNPSTAPLKEKVPEKLEASSSSPRLKSPSGKSPLAEEPVHTLLVLAGESLPINGPQGAWSKPLSLTSNSPDTVAEPNSELSPDLNWPSLSASNQSHKRLSRNASAMPPRRANTRLSEISKAEEETLKVYSRDYPWAAKMDQSLRNLHRVTMPDYMDDGTPLVNIPSHVLLEGLENQKEFIVGQFYRCVAPSGGLVHAVVNRIWGKNCRIFTRKLSESSYLFHIPNESTRKWIIQRGLWHVDDCLMFVSAWTPAESITLPEITTVPAWLTLKNIPNQLYSIKGIKWIASGIGEPMLTSRPWLDPTQMGEAKILVEVKLDKPFPQRVALKEQCGTITMVDVIYSWIPSKCSKCGQLGHKATRCLGIGLENDIAPELVNNTNSVPIGSFNVPPTSNVDPLNVTTPTDQNASLGSDLGVVITAGAASESGGDLAESNDIVPACTDSTHTTLQKAVNNSTKSVSAVEDAPSSAQLSLQSSKSTISAKDASRVIDSDSTSVREGVSNSIKGKGSSANQFAALEWGSDMAESEDSDDDDDLIKDLMTPSTDRQLRDRPVKLSQKATEMAASLNSSRGRGRRGRGKRGGRGRS